MISLDSLRFLRKKKFWISLSCVFVIIVMVFVDLQDDQRFKHWDAKSITTTVSHLYIEYEEEYPEYAELVKAYGDKLNKALTDEDWQVVNYTISDIYTIQASNLLVKKRRENISLYYHDFFRGKEAIQKLARERNVPVITEEMADSIVDVSWESPVSIEVYNFSYFRLQAQYYKELGDKNIEALSYGTIDSSTIFVQFIRSLFPILLILLTTIMCYDVMQEDKDSGVVKVLLSQPKKRSYYLNKKIIINLKAVICVFFVPLVILSLCYGFFDHYQTIQGPILANVQGIHEVSMQDNTLGTPANYLYGSTGEGQIGVTKYYTTPVTSASPNPELDFMPMWQFVGLCFIMSILLIGFFVLLNIFLAVLIKNKIVVLATSLIILLVGTFFANPANTGILYACLPITYMNPVDILSGYSTYSYLNGIFVLCITNAFLYVVVQMLYKRKDKVC